MKYGGKVLLLVSVVAICLLGHLVFSQQIDGTIGSKCETSELCREVTNNSECNPVKRKCFCIPGYGYDEVHFTPTCNPFPLYHLVNVTFEMDAYLNCMVHLSNVTEIQWFRNGQDLCTTETPWCSQDKTTQREEENNYLSQLIIRSVISNDNYTCVALNSDGKKWTVSNHKIVVGPYYKPKRFNHVFHGTDLLFYCTVLTSDVQVRLVRDGIETCTLESIWCSQENHPQPGGTSVFKILNLRENHIFTCEAYRGRERLATLEVLNVMVGPKPEILELIISPNSHVQKGTKMTATGRVRSHVVDPKSHWTLDGVLLNDSMATDLKALSEKEYESMANFGPIYSSCNLTFAVRNMYGIDTKHIQVVVDGAVGVFAIRKESIVTCALAVLLSLFRSTTFNV